MLINDLETVLINEEEIKKIVKKLADEVTEDYTGRQPLLIGLLKGCHPFMSDFMKELDIHVEVDYMDVSSYFGGTKSSGEIKLEKDLTTEVRGKDIIIVEDIVDSGKTIKYVIDLLKFRGANSVEVCTFINKQEGRKVDLNAKYIGYEVENQFIIGYGLDLNEKYRNLVAVGIPKQEVIDRGKEANE